MAEIDQITVATRQCLKWALATMDRLFNTDPLLASMATKFADDFDEFTDWVLETRAEAGIQDPPRDRASRGGAQSTNAK